MCSTATTGSVQNQIGYWTRVVSLHVSWDCRYASDETPLSQFQWLWLLVIISIFNNALVSIMQQFSNVHFWPQKGRWQRPRILFFILKKYGKLSLKQQQLFENPHTSESEILSEIRSENATTKRKRVRWLRLWAIQDWATHLQQVKMATHARLQEGRGQAVGVKGFRRCSSRIRRGTNRNARGNARLPVRRSRNNQYFWWHVKDWNDEFEWPTMFCSSATLGHESWSWVASSSDTSRWFADSAP